MVATSQESCGVQFVLDGVGFGKNITAGGGIHVHVCIPAPAP